ncbi:MAG: class I SAM-dependent methyltransferase [Limisphaerales bacterium]
MMSVRVSRQSSEFDGRMLSAAPSLRTPRLGAELAAVLELTAEAQRTPGWPRDFLGNFVAGIKRRWRRERRRRKVGRAYDMALEIARVLPRGSEVLDVGCGNGFIAHHLSAVLGTAVVGIDLEKTTEAPIDYRAYDRVQFPAADNAFDAVLLSYVLHHAEDVRVVLDEVKRVVRDGGFAIIYEDIPETWWDRFICAMHNLQWRNRTGPCTFRTEREWSALFASCGFEVMSERQLARLRNFTHPVRRRFFVLSTAS